MASSVMSLLALKPSSLPERSLAKGLPTVPRPSSSLKVQTSGGKRSKTATPYGPGGGLALKDGLDACGRKPRSLAVRAAKLPAGVEAPKAEPKLTEPFWGFTRTAEVWNSRTCMIGIVGIFILELILHKGILQVIGVDVGKGLNLPL